MENIIIKVPTELAELVIDERVARKRKALRGTDAISVLTLAADLTSTVTAVIVSRAAIAEFARSLARGFARKADDERSLTITVESHGQTQIIVKPNNTKGIQELSAHIEVIINEFRMENG